MLLSDQYILFDLGKQQSFLMHTTVPVGAEAGGSVRQAAQRTTGTDPCTRKDEHQLRRP